jgi:predicted N-acetyltransferase YhbS
MTSDVRCPASGPRAMRISYLADQPALAAPLIPGLLEQWRHVLPEQTAETRAAKFRAHMNRDNLPIAWVAHEGSTVFGTAALRAVDVEGREDLTPWLAGVYVLPQFRRRGIASALCEVVEAKARGLRMADLYLFTLDQAQLYARLGWRFFGRAKWRGREGEIMVKHIGDRLTAVRADRDK